MKNWYIYILWNKNNTVLYVWVTSNIIQRIYQHKEKLVDGFSKKYNCSILLYFEVFENISQAIKREKYIKWKKRAFKEELIKKLNPEQKDLYSYILWDSSVDSLPQNDDDTNTK